LNEKGGRGRTGFISWNAAPITRLREISLLLKEGKAGRKRDTIYEKRITNLNTFRNNHYWFYGFLIGKTHHRNFK